MGDLAEKNNAPELEKKTNPDSARESNRKQRKNNKDVCFVRFSIKSEEHSSKELTELFEMDSNDFIDDGELVFEANRYLMHSRGIWVLNTREIVNENLLEDHLKWLIDYLYDKRVLIRNLQADGARINITAHVEPHDGIACTDIDSEIIQRLSQLKLSLSIKMRCQNERNY